jgi:hypothetical protein
LKFPDSSYHSLEKVYGRAVQVALERAMGMQRRFAMGISQQIATRLASKEEEILRAGDDATIRNSTSLPIKVGRNASVR